MRFFQKLNRVVEIFFASGLFVFTVLEIVDVLIGADRIQSPFTTAAQVIKDGPHLVFVFNQLNVTDPGIDDTGQLKVDQTVLAVKKQRSQWSFVG